MGKWKKNTVNQNNKSNNINQPSQVFKPKKPRSFNASGMVRRSTPLGIVKAPVVYYTPEAWLAIQHLVAIAPKEVGWMGLVDTLEKGDYLITEIFIPEQEATATEADIKPEAVMALYNQLMDQDIDTSKLIYWGHSHVNMGVTPSGQDEDQLEEYLQMETCNVFIRGIYNKSNAEKVDVIEKTNGMVHECVETNILIPQHITDHIEAEYDKNVTEYVYVPPKQQNGAYGGYGGGYWGGYYNQNQNPHAPPLQQPAYGSNKQQMQDQYQANLISDHYDDLGDLDDDDFLN